MSDVSELYDQADQLKEQGDLEGAVEKLQAALAIDETYALAHSAMAVVQQKLGDHETAVKHAVRVCDLEAGDPFSFTAMSVTYQRAYAGTNNMDYIRLAEDAMEKSRILSQQG